MLRVLRLLFLLAIGRRGGPAALLAALLLLPRVAFADGLRADELSALEQGSTVVRRLSVEQNDQRYVGGITYTIVDATPDELLGMLDDVEAYREVLPRTKYAERIFTRSPDLFIELHHGNAVVDGVYTLMIHKDPNNNRVRFWVDLSRPHAVDDAWGFFRYEILAPARGEPRLLLTYGVLLDLGDGMLRSLYEERVTNAMLNVPQHVREYVLRKFRARG